MRAHDSFLWRWKPHACRLFDPRPVGQHSDSLPTLLHKLGDAKIVFAGDSIVMEQYNAFEVGATAILHHQKAHPLPVHAAEKEDSDAEALACYCMQGVTWGAHH